MSQMYHIYNGNILILVGGVYKCSKLKMLGFNVVPSATWDLDSRRHGTLTQSMASRGPGRRESRSLLPYCYCYWKIISFAFLVCIPIDTKYVKWEQRSVNFLKFWSTLVHVHNCFQINFVPFFGQNEGKPAMRDRMKQVSCSQRDCFTVSTKVGSKGIICPYYHIQIILHFLS